MRCTLHAQPVSLLTYGLNLTCKGTRVIFKLLHKLCFFLNSFLFQCLTHTEKAYKLAVIQRATDTGAITYQLFTLSPFGRRGLCGARCGLLSPRDLSPDTHRLSYFYVLQVHVIGYGCRSVAFQCLS